MFDPGGNGPVDLIRRSCIDFFADRLKVQQRDAGVRHDLIDAVFALGGEDDLVRLLARVEALQRFVETAEGADLLAGYKRAANILKKEKWDRPRMASRASRAFAQTGEEDPLVLVEEPMIAAAVAEMARGSTQPADAPAEEAALVDALDAAEPQGDQGGRRRGFHRCHGRAGDAARADRRVLRQGDGQRSRCRNRARRLNLLARFRDAVHAVADFSKIEG